jgi:antitoxin VapB
MVTFVQIAKRFMDGSSQVVCLPDAYRFDAEHVFIRKDPVTGDVILSAKPQNWDSFFAALKAADVPDDFLNPDERQQGLDPPDPFAGWEA